MDWSAVPGFLIAVLVLGGLGIDNGVLVEMEVSKFRLTSRQHSIARSMVLILMAGLRMFFLFGISWMTFLSLSQSDTVFGINRYFAEHPEELTWLHFVYFYGGIMVIGIALWEYYKKVQEERLGEHHSAAAKRDVAFISVAKSALYMLLIGSLLSIDSVFSLLSMMDVDKDFPWMIAAVGVAALIMVFGMVPISRIIQRSVHIKVQMLTVLVVIGAKLLVDGTAGHFSNGLLTFIILIIIANDAGQSVMVKADAEGNAKSSSDDSSSESDQEKAL